MEKPALIFDVNETLLNMVEVKKALEKVFRSKQAFRLWFDQLLIYSETFTLIDDYFPFSEIGLATLKMLAEIYEIELTEDDIGTWSEAFAQMPPYEEVPLALARLKSAGFKLYTLTNNPVKVQTQQLTAGQIDQYFDGKYSIEAVQSFKPHLKTYRYMQEELGLPAEQIMLIACHIWDTLGAAKAGWQTAFIRRPENAPLPIGAQPDVDFENLNDFASDMIQKYQK